MTKILGRDDLLSVNYLKRELVEFPDLGISVYMREFSSTQVLEFNARIKQYREKGIKETTPEIDLDLMVFAISLSACDESGNLLFSSEEEAKRLKDTFGISLIDVLSTKALDISGLNKNLTAALSTEVADNLPNAPMTSSLENSRKNSRKRARKS
jgi:hypothetical protein